jgi:hypothetical protein
VRLMLPFPEALELALRGAPLPALISELVCSGATVRADLDLRAVPSPPFALRAVAMVAPIVRVHATFRSFDAGKATFDLRVRAASVPLQRLLNQLTGLLNSGLRSQHLPPGLVTVAQGPDGDPIVVVDLQAGVDANAAGVTVTRFAIDDGAVEVAATVHGFALRAG